MSEELKSEFSAIFNQQTEEDEQESLRKDFNGESSCRSNSSNRRKVDVNRKIVVKNRPSIATIEIYQDSPNT